jgi:hypothetical protein
MKLATSQITKLVITDVKGMDPISVMAEDFGPGAGKITITCWGEAWTHYWSHMGEQNTMRSFFLKASTSYLIGKLKTGIRSRVDDENDEALSLAMRKWIIAHRRDGGLTAEEARAQWDQAELVTFGDHVDLCREVFGDEWWEHLPKKANPDYEHIGKIVDTVKAAFALESLQQKEAA